MEIDRQAMERIQGSPVALYQDPATGSLYAFCSRECQRLWAEAEEEHKPDGLNEKFGCFWCGRSMYPGGVEAWEDPKNRII